MSRPQPRMGRGGRREGCDRRTHHGYPVGRTATSRGRPQGRPQNHRHQCATSSRREAAPRTTEHTATCERPSRSTPPVTYPACLCCGVAAAAAAPESPPSATAIRSPTAKPAFHSRRIVPAHAVTGGTKVAERRLPVLCPERPGRNRNAASGQRSLLAQGRGARYVEMERQVGEEVSAESTEHPRRDPRRAWLPQRLAERRAKGVRVRQECTGYVQPGWRPPSKC